LKERTNKQKFEVHGFTTTLIQIDHFSNLTNFVLLAKYYIVAEKWYCLNMTVKL